MKLPKTLLQAIFIGITAGSMVACTDEVISPRENQECGTVCSGSHGEDCPANIPEPCPACGMG